MTYTELKKKQADEFAEFPMFFAFSDTQFAEGLKKFGIKNEDAKKEIYHIGAGGYIRKSDSEKLAELYKKLEVEMDEAMKDDEFCIGAIEYELGNHEYSYTGDAEPALEVLGYTLDDLDKDSRLKGLFLAARKRVIDFENARK